jgi:hypothetical protein
VPVLGVNGAVVGNVSARDLRQLILNPAVFRLISLPVRQFLSTVSSIEHEAMCPAITARPRDTMEHVISQVPLVAVALECGVLLSCLFLSSVSHRVARGVEDPPYVRLRWVWAPAARHQPHRCHRCIRFGLLLLPPLLPCLLHPFSFLVPFHSFLLQSPSDSYFERFSK